MSRSKAGLILFLCLCMICPCALAESPNLSPVENIRVDEVIHSTAQAETGAYERFVNMQAAAWYPMTASLRYEGKSAKFVEYKVKRDAAVKAGDVLAVFAPVVDEVTLAGLRVDLERMQGEYESGRMSRLEEIEALTRQLAEIRDQYEREELVLRIARAELSLEQYDYQQQLAIDEVREAIAQIEADAAQTTLVAPFDGVVTSTNYLHAGDRVPVGEVLITLQSSERMLLCVNNAQGDFRFGMNVTVTAGKANEKTTYTGRVVGADTQLPASQRIGIACIEIDGWNGTEIVNPSVSAAAVRLENIVLVPRRAVRQDNKKYVVHKLENGVLCRRYVNFVMQNSNYAWIIQGVEPGETIIID